MIEGKKALGVIPARGGSRGVPGKNIRVVAGKPLIAWTIEEAKKSKYLDRVVVSSDDDEIIRVAKEWGGDVPFVRPEELARDDTPGVEPVLHAMRALPGYDYVVLLQPTSPLRSALDIDGCLELCVKQGFPACVSVTEPDKSPYWMFKIDRDGRILPIMQEEEVIPRRQDLPPVYVFNGAIYIANCGWLEKIRAFIAPETRAYQMPKERSVDIDTELDLLYVELFLTGQNRTAGRPLL